VDVTSQDFLFQKKGEKKKNEKKMFFQKENKLN